MESHHLLCPNPVSRLFSCTLSACVSSLVSSVVPISSGARYRPKAVAIPLPANIFFAGVHQNSGHNPPFSWLVLSCSLFSSALHDHMCDMSHPSLHVVLLCLFDPCSCHLCHSSSPCYSSLQGSSTCRFVHHCVLFASCQSAYLLLPLSAEVSAEVPVRHRPCLLLPLPYV